MNPQYKISKELVDNLLKYLTSRPYSEVYQGINALLALEQIKQVEQGPITPQPTPEKKEIDLPVEPQTHE